MILSVLKILMKAVIFPILLALKALSCLGRFFFRISDIVFHTISAVLVITGAAAWILGLDPWNEAVKVILAGALFFLIPQTGTIMLFCLQIIQEGFLKLLEA